MGENTVQEVKIITEGTARIFEEGNVFYNPVQEFNRDVSICVLNTFFEIYHKELDLKEANRAKPSNKPKKKIRILEALAATGLRSIRYAKEVKGFDEVVANDLLNGAVKMIKKNVEANGVEDKVTVNHADATIFMYTSTSYDKRFTVIDLDPYGTPSKFIDAAIQSIEDGGLLCITATDMAVLAGNTPEACIVKYGSVPIRSKACHELALRILLRSIESQANKYGRYIKPLLSLSIDFYVRLFVRVYTGQFQCKESSTKQSMVFQCTGCETLTLQPLAYKKTSIDNPNSIKFNLPTGPYVNTNCEHCSNKHHMGGPIWSANIHDFDFVNNLINYVKIEGTNLGTYSRLIGVLTMVQEELPDVPLYYKIDQICHHMRVATIPALKMRSAILHENYRVSYSHACKNSIKTDAPISLLWDILRYWAKLNPVNPAKITEGSVVKALLSKEPTKEYEFDFIHQDANPPSRRDALTRFQINPTVNWGPGTRNQLMVEGNKPSISKNIRNQGKNKKKRNNNDDNEEEKLPDSKHVKIDDAEMTESDEIKVTL
ncbi:hypothetical protein PVAND_005249 [Polypedilum vanderplanki]|uniref:tRNA (guanine(26)-N(2))-dimethyltransferase n=1 Tax=Polypedilum vanderplanki TaxID=319348 RepID=A0A9J6C0J7_POLVA|nr:hypothetical protein PVAND_005249 [Polypedilum vanderplanki]